MRSRTLNVKNESDIARIHDAGRIIASIFDELRQTDLVGQSTLEVDSFIESKILSAKSRPAFQTVPRYHHASCISINDEVLHGIPHKKKFIQKGDLVKVDIGVVKNGYFADACRTYLTGRHDARQALLDATETALDRAIAKLVINGRMGDVGSEIQRTAEENGYGIVTSYMGHGTGFALHEAPPVPSVGKGGTGMQLREGMVLALEPMLTGGKSDVEQLDDGWTVVTVDGSDSAEFEDSVAITKKGPVILTR